MTVKWQDSQYQLQSTGERRSDSVIQKREWIFVWVREWESSVTYMREKEKCFYAGMFCWHEAEHYFYLSSFHVSLFFKIYFAISSFYWSLPNVMWPNLMPHPSISWVWHNLECWLKLGSYPTPLLFLSVSSTITSWGKSGEVEAFKNMLQNFPTGLVSIVSDSYDIWNACKEVLGKTLKDVIIKRGEKGVLVVRPDSGEPKDVVVEVRRSLCVLKLFSRVTGSCCWWRNSMAF